MTPRFFSWLGVLVVLIGLTACHPPANPQDQKPVRQAFADFKAALGSRQARQALAGLDRRSLDYMRTAVTMPPDASASGAELRELIRSAAARLTPGGIQPGFQLETPLQHMLNAGWIRPHDLQEFDLGPVAIQGGQAQAELLRNGDPTTLQLVFVHESGTWKIDLLSLRDYAELALRVDRMMKGQTEAQQIERLVAQVPAP